MSTLTDPRPGPRCAALFTVESPAICVEPADHDGDHRPYRAAAEQRIQVDWSFHTIPAYAVGETCRCGQKAAHKIGETSGPETFHPMTAYLCCVCFSDVLGPCGSYPYDIDQNRSVFA